MALLAAASTNRSHGFLPHGVWTGGGGSSGGGPQRLSGQWMICNVHIRSAGSP